MTRWLTKGTEGNEEISSRSAIWRRRASRPADSRIRTDDLIITNDLLYQLSYIGVMAKKAGYYLWSTRASNEQPPDVF
jgi:hypothetical protein